MHRMKTYTLPVEISLQEDGLSRAACPLLQGCWVDSKTLGEAVQDIQEAMVLWITSQKVIGWQLPPGLEACAEFPIHARIPVALL